MKYIDWNAADYGRPVIIGRPGTTRGRAFIERRYYRRFVLRHARTYSRVALAAVIAAAMAVIQ